MCHLQPWRGSAHENASAGTPGKWQNQAGTSSGWLLLRVLPVAAPFFFKTARQTFFMSLGRLLATSCAIFVRTTRGARVLHSSFDMAGRFATASARSMRRSFLCSHTQDRSTGMRSGDFGGIFHNATPALACAAFDTFARRKDSLSHRAFQGPRGRTGVVSVIALGRCP